MFESSPTNSGQNGWTSGTTPAEHGGSGGTAPTGGAALSTRPAALGASAGPPPDGAVQTLFSHWGDTGAGSKSAKPPRGRTKLPTEETGGDRTSLQQEQLNGPGDKTTQKSTDLPLGPCGDLTWRGIGNLLGNPPVRSEEPPNKAIVEDQATYQRAHLAASAGLAVQQERAEGMKAGGEVSDNRYWFAKVYSYVTKYELEYAENQQFYYPTYALHSVRYFEQIYSDNVAAANAGGVPEAHWAAAFKMASSTKAAAEKTGSLRDFLVLCGIAAPELMGPAALGAILGQEINKLLAATMSLVASMKAHIRFDLPRAEVWVFNSLYKQMKTKPEWACDPRIHDATLADFQSDFGAMFGVFERATEEMNKEISKFASRLAALIPGSVQDWAMSNVFDANMQAERADTWERAMELEKSNPTTGPYKDDGHKLIGNVTANDNTAMLQSLPNSLKPSMESSAKPLDDDDVRAQVKQRGESGLVAETASKRIRMIQGLLSGMTGDDDESAILTLLRASRAAGDLTVVVDSVSAHSLGSAVDGEEYDTLRQLLIQSYYAETNGQTAFSLIVRCMDGETAEWEEEMVADILVSRARVDGRALIEQIGEHYEGTRSFNEGLNKIEWQLDGDEQDRVAAIYGKSE